MCKLFIICQHSLKPPTPSFVTISTKHSYNLQLGLLLKVVDHFYNDVYIYARKM